MSSDKFNKKIPSNPSHPTPAAPQNPLSKPAAPNVHEKNPKHNPSNWKK